jgi:hypothetical protein
MDHLAIMRKSWGLTDKLLSGQKIIESRWYKHRYSPWDRINSGDTVYFKNTGEMVSSKATVAKVLQFSNLSPLKVQELLNNYGRDIGLNQSDISSYFSQFKDKKYCLLIFLKHSQSVVPFQINKSGFGAMSSWITVDHISDIKI